MHVSEYGVAVDETETTHACATEEEVYELLGMAYVEPELREDRGELEAARAGELPELVDRRRHQGRPALAHRGLGRPQHASTEMAEARARHAGTSTWRSPTTRPPTGSATT